MKLTVVIRLPLKLFFEGSDYCMLAAQFRLECGSIKLGAGRDQLGLASRHRL